MGMAKHMSAQHRVYFYGGPTNQRYSPLVSRGMLNEANRALV